MAGRRRRREATAERPPPDGDTAMEIAVHFLGSRPRTRWELQRRLRRAGASDEVIDATMARLARLGYVDDIAFARWWAEQRDRHAPRGRRLVEAELRQRGVPREVLERLREEESPAADETHGLPSTDAERAQVALTRHLRGRPLPDDRQALQRLGQFLIRRGFDPETARAAIRVAAAESTPGGSTGDPDGMDGTDG
ncbi:MAG: regulatory protein RecX [Chloroflexi bacterium]|nr:MAG: regulatory protein RecX [Chloroflexota bacterium]